MLIDVAKYAESPVGVTRQEHDSWPTQTKLKDRSALPRRSGCINEFEQGVPDTFYEFALKGD